MLGGTQEPNLTRLRVGHPATGDSASPGRSGLRCSLVLWWRVRGFPTVRPDYGAGAQVQRGGEKFGEEIAGENYGMAAAPGVNGSTIGACEE